MLDTPMDISLNDQINAIDSQSRAAIRAAGQNPSAQAMIMAQALEAKNKVLGEQTRINAANKMQTFDKNRALVNDAKLRNLQILDQQYVRQAQARSNTREQTFNALSSIAAKTAQQRAANRKLAVMENMYGFRFTPSGRAINVNAPAQFNTSSFASNSDKGLGIVLTPPHITELFSELSQVNKKSIVF
jgi:recombinational DNA repair ATPase RecF